MAWSLDPSIRPKAVVGHSIGPSFPLPPIVSNLGAATGQVRGRGVWHTNSEWSAPRWSSWPPGSSPRFVVSFRSNNSRIPNRPDSSGIPAPTHTAAASTYLHGAALLSTAIRLWLLSRGNLRRLRPDTLCRVADGDGHRDAAVTQATTGWSKHHPAGGSLQRFQLHLAAEYNDRQQPRFAVGVCGYITACRRRSVPIRARGDAPFLGKIRGPLGLAAVVVGWHWHKCVSADPGFSSIASSRWSST